MTTAATIRALWEEGVTPDEEIARLAGVSKQYVHQVLGRKASRRPSIGAACRKIRKELERPIVLTVHSPLFEAGVGTHGTPGAYKRGCSCALCVEAHRLDHAAVPRRWRAGRLNPTHGKASTYKSYGCRCRACTKANAAEYHAYMERRLARSAA